MYKYLQTFLSRGILDYSKSMVNHKCKSLFSSIGLVSTILSTGFLVCSDCVQSQTLTAFRGFQLPGWATEAWIKNDKPYKKIEDEVDTAIARHEFTMLDIATYQTQADKNIHDPLVQFRWTYAVYRANQENSPIKSGLYPFTSALGRAPNPHSYEYSRIGFLIQTQFSPDPHYVNLGERLLAQKPSDYLVEYKLAGCIDPTHSPEAKIKAFKYAHDLIRMKPNDPRSYVALGGVYYYLWSVSHNHVEGQQAIIAYQHSLQLDPPEKGKNLANSIIDEIRHG